jgi:predicted lipid-binding transport protein (Tim44 family)
MMRRYAPDDRVGDRTMTAGGLAGRLLAGGLLIGLAGMAHAASAAGAQARADWLLLAIACLTLVLGRTLVLHRKGTPPPPSA